MKNLKEKLAKIIASDVKNKNILISGGAGLGKSQTVQQVAVEHGYLLIDLRCAYLERPDILGYPVPNTQTNQTEFLTPNWQALLFDAKNKKVILFLDELNRADTSLLNTLMELLTERCIMQRHVKCKELVVISAINPVSDEYIGTNDLDLALKSRFFFKIEVSEHKPSTVAYLKTKYSNELQASLLEFYENIENKLQPRELETGLQCLCNGNDLDLLELCTGVNFTNQFKNFLHDFAPIKDFSNIENVKAKLIKYKNSNRNDLIALSIKNYEKINSVDYTCLFTILENVNLDMAHGLVKNLTLSNKISLDKLVSECKAQNKKEIIKSIQDLIKE
jgi:hypothetical protein